MQIDESPESQIYDNKDAIIEIEEDNKDVNLINDEDGNKNENIRKGKIIKI